MSHRAHMDVPQVIGVPKAIAFPNTTDRCLDDFELKTFPFKKTIENRSISPAFSIMLQSKNLYTLW